MRTTSCAMRTSPSTARTIEQLLESEVVHMGQVVEFPGVLGSGEKRIDAATRLQCLLMAESNEERAQLCTKDQAPLRKLFEMNAQLLKDIAR